MTVEPLMPGVLFELTEHSVGAAEYLKNGDPLPEAAFEACRRAIRDRTLMHLNYGDESGRETARNIRPVALHFWGERWTVAAWCEKRRDFRLFRLDRINAISPTAQRFRDEPGKTYADFLRTVDVRQRND